MKKIIEIIIRLIPMVFLLYPWTGMEGVKEFAGITFCDRSICLIGLVIMFIPVFLKTKPSIDVGINLVGNVLCWGRMFYKAAVFMNPKYLTSCFYLTIAVAIVSVFIQIYIIYQDKTIVRSERENIYRYGSNGKRGLA